MYGDCETTLYIIFVEERILPTIPPQDKELEKSEAVRQAKTKAVHEEPKIVRVEVHKYIRVLIILHYCYCCYVAKPIEIWISRVRPHADKTETDLNRTANGIRTLHRSLSTTDCLKTTTGSMRGRHVEIVQYAPHDS